MTPVEMKTENRGSKRKKQRLTVLAMTSFTSFNNQFVQTSQKQNPCAHHSSAIKQNTGFPFLCRMYCYTCTLLINFKPQKPHILEHYQFFKFVSTHLFHPVPLLHRFYLKKHILWRGSEDKCNACSLILPSLTFKARRLQYHHIDLILYSSYKYFCEASPRNSIQEN